MPPAFGLILLDLREASFGEIFEALTAGFIVLLGAIAIGAAPNDLPSIIRWIGYATAVAPFLAACFAVVMWIVFEVAG